MKESKIFLNNRVWPTAEAIADVMGWLEACGHDPDVVAEIERMIPASVFQKLIMPPTGSDLSGAENF